MEGRREAGGGEESKPVRTEGAIILFTRIVTLSTPSRACVCSPRELNESFLLLLLTTTCTVMKSPKTAGALSFEILK